MNAKNRLGGTGHVTNDSANHLADRLRNVSLVQRIEQSHVVGNCIGFSNSYDMKQQVLSLLNTYCYKITDCSITSIYVLVFLLNMTSEDDFAGMTCYDNSRQRSD